MDPEWMFPALSGAESGAVAAALARADAGLRRLAGRLGRPGGGLESDGMPELRYTGGVFGTIEVAEVYFRAGLYVPRRCGLDLRYGPPWEVLAEIEAWCDPEGCVGHRLAGFSESCDDPVEAARGLVRASDWLAGVALSETPDGWRARVAGACRGASGG